MLRALVSLTLLCLPNLGSAVELGFRSLESYPGTKIPNYDGGKRPFAEILMFVSCHTTTIDAQFKSLHCRSNLQWRVSSELLCWTRRLHSRTDHHGLSWGELPFSPFPPPSLLGSKIECHSTHGLMNVEGRVYTNVSFDHSFYSIVFSFLFVLVCRCTHFQKHFFCRFSFLLSFFSFPFSLLMYPGRRSLYKCERLYRSLYWRGGAVAL